MPPDSRLPPKNCALLHSRPTKARRTHAHPAPPCKLRPQCLTPPARTAACYRSARTCSRRRSRGVRSLGARVPCLTVLGHREGERLLDRLEALRARHRARRAARIATGGSRRHRTRHRRGARARRHRGRGGRKRAPRETRGRVGACGALAPRVDLTRCATIRQGLAQRQRPLRQFADELISERRSQKWPPTHSGWRRRARRAQSAKRVGRREQRGRDERGRCGGALGRRGGDKRAPGGGRRWCDE